MLKVNNKINALLIALIGVLGFNSLVNCQTSHNEKGTLENFLEVLFDENVPASEVVDNHVYTEKYTASNNDVVDGRTLAIKHVLWVRQEMNKDSGYVLPNYQIANKQNRVIGRYLDYKDVSPFSFAELSKKDLEQIYIVLNLDKTEVHHYFLIENTKILSFCSLAKGKDYLNFFIYSDS